MDDLLAELFRDDEPRWKNTREYQELLALNGSTANGNTSEMSITVKKKETEIIVIENSNEKNSGDRRFEQGEYEATHAFSMKELFPFFVCTDEDGEARDEKDTGENRAPRPRKIVVLGINFKRTYVC